MIIQQNVNSSELYAANKKISMNNIIKQDLYE